MLTELGHGTRKTSAVAFAAFVAAVVLIALGDMGSWEFGLLVILIAVIIVSIRRGHRERVGFRKDVSDGDPTTKSVP